MPSKSSNYGVYLPPGYDDPANASREYPWVLWLHGMSEDDRDFHFGGAKVLDEQVASGALPPLVFIAAAAPSRTLYANGEVEGNIRDLITKDLVSDVQKRFRVASKREERALMGVSLGGMAALRFAFTDPQLFGSVATHSAAVFPEKLDELDQNYVETVHRFGDRLGGWPIPEQWDPRYTAAAASHDYLRLFDRMPTDAERAACAAEVPDWTQLLQVSLADLGTDYAEGTVYFVMRRADLAAREFGRVHAIYQQT